MTATGSRVKRDSSRPAPDPFAAPRASSREAIAGIRIHTCTILSPDTGPVETATAVEMNDGGPSADFFWIIPTAVCKSLRNNRSGFRTVPTGPAAVPPRCHLGNEDRIRKPGLWRQELRS